MKKIFILALVVVFVSSFFTSCTDNIITDDDELVFQTQASKTEGEDGEIEPDEVDE